MTVPNSKILVDSIEGYDPVGPVNVSYGATIPPGAVFQINGNADFSPGIVTIGTYNGGNINATGIVTAASFVGDSSGFSNLPIINDSKAIAFTLLG